MANATEWTKRVSAWRASGLGAAEFCAERGYSVKSLWHWSSKLGRARSSEVAGMHRGKPRMQLARVARSTLSLAHAEPASIVVEIGGARLTVRGQVDAAALRAVVVGLRDAAVEAVR